MCHPTVDPFPTRRAAGPFLARRITAWATAAMGKAKGRERGGGDMDVKREMGGTY